MKRKVMLQLVVPLLSLCVLFLLLTMDPVRSQGRTELLEVSVLFRDADSSAMSAARQGMEQAAVDMDVELRFLNLSEDGLAEEQQELLRREAENGADGVLLIPADRDVLCDAVKEVSASIPVVTMETEMADCGAAGYVSVDNTALGEALGTMTLNGAPEGSAVVLVNTAPDATGISDRVEAAAQVLQAAQRRVYFCRPYGGDNLEEALKTEVKTWSASAVLAFDTAALEASARVLGQMGDAPLLYGAGSSAAIAAYLEQGTITAVAARNEFAAGYLAVEMLVHAINGTASPKAQLLEFSVVRKETMYQPEHEKLLFPVTR